MTNFERLKQMSVEEFAKEMCNGFRCELCIYRDEEDGSFIQTYCVKAFIEYLNKEVNTDES